MGTNNHSEKKTVKVVVGLSGGVDSSVAAYLLKQQGYDVTGIFMRNWHDDSVIIDSECPWIEDSTDAMMVAERLGIPFVVLDFSKEYYERIVNYMFSEYQAGRTPNPDVLCNREIKFDLFLKAALKLGAEFVGTGHYCQRDVLESNGQKVYRLLAGADPNKDQSYFLCQLRQDQLARALFPIGHMLKEEVRRVASELGLVTAEKKDSQGLCFIGKVRLPEFLQQKLKPKEGQIILVDAAAMSFATVADTTGTSAENLADNHLDVLCSAHQYLTESGKVIGSHQGAHFYTIGQRKGLNVGGMQEGLYVIGTDTQTNTLYTGMGEHHPGLYRNGLFVPREDVHWIREDQALKPGTSARYLVRIRYREPLGMATLVMREKGLYILFDDARRGIAPGQFAAWYLHDECLGSGVIA